MNIVNSSSPAACLYPPSLFFLFRYQANIVTVIGGVEFCVG